MDIPLSALQWITGTDTGISSKTIFAALSGAVKGPQELDSFGQYDVPHDADDFGRCYRLIESVPEWKCQLSIVAKAFPAWEPFIREWSMLEVKYLTNRGRLFDFIQTLEDESRRIDGWIQDSPNSWRKQCASKSSRP